MNSSLDSISSRWLLLQLHGGVGEYLRASITRRNEWLRFGTTSNAVSIAIDNHERAEHTQATINVDDSGQQWTVTVEKQAPVVVQVGSCPYADSCLQYCHKCRVCVHIFNC